MQNAKDLLISLANARIVVQGSDFCTAREGGHGPTGNERSAGFVCDEVMKRLLWPYSVRENVQRFAMFDIETDEFFVEVKSSTKYFHARNQVWISPGEIEHATTALEAGKDTLIVFMDARQGAVSYRDLKTITIHGAVWFSEVQHSIEPSGYRSHQFTQEFLMPIDEIFEDVSIDIVSGV